MTLNTLTSVEEKAIFSILMTIYDECEDKHVHIGQEIEDLISYLNQSNIGVCNIVGGCSNCDAPNCKVKDNDLVIAIGSKIYRWLD